MVYMQALKLLSLFFALGSLRCLSLRSREPEDDALDADGHSAESIGLSEDTMPLASQAVTTGSVGFDPSPESHRYQGDVYLTLYKDTGCDQLRYHHRIRPGTCVRTNMDSGKMSGMRTIYNAVGGKKPFDHAYLSEHGELYMCQEGCRAKTCSPTPVDWPLNGPNYDCTQPDLKIGAHVSSVRVGLPQVSLQFFQSSECGLWFEKREEQIWQHDVWFGDCFETTFPVMGLKFGKINSDYSMQLCKDKACVDCNPAPGTYLRDKCVDPYYVDEPAKRKHNALRIQEYSVVEASTILDDPNCVKRIAMIHSTKDALKVAHKNLREFHALPRSCETQKQNLDLRNLFLDLQHALRTEDVGFLSARGNPVAPAVSLAEVEPHTKVFLVSVYKDNDCKQWRNHIKVTEEKCIPLAQKDMKSKYMYATVKNSEVNFCEAGCVTCQVAEEYPTTECTVIGDAKSYVKAVRVGNPEISVQFFQDPECPHWHDKRSSGIWQHDLFYNECFEAWAPIGRKGLNFGFVEKKTNGDTTEIKLLSCADKACTECQQTHYEFEKCEDAKYIDFPADAQHTALRYAKWQSTEAATMYDQFPACLDRVNRVHQTMDLVKDATAKADAVNSLPPSCLSPKQDDDMWNLGRNLRNSLTDMRRDPRYFSDAW